MILNVAAKAVETVGDNKREGELLFNKFKCFYPVFGELKLKLDA